MSVKNDTNGTSTLSRSQPHTAVTASSIACHLSDTHVRTESIVGHKVSVKNAPRGWNTFSLSHSQPADNLSTTQSQPSPKAVVNFSHSSRPVSVCVKKYVSPATSAAIAITASMIGFAAITRLNAAWTPAAIFVAAVHASNTATAAPRDTTSGSSQSLFFCTHSPKVFNFSMPVSRACTITGRYFSASPDMLLTKVSI